MTSSCPRCGRELEVLRSRRHLVRYCEPCDLVVRDEDRPEPDDPGAERLDMAIG